MVKLLVNSAWHKCENYMNVLLNLDDSCWAVLRFRGLTLNDSF